jgi:prophage regulatory protein
MQVLINRKGASMLKLNAVKELTGLSRSSIYSYMARGEFPRQIKLGKRSVAWVDDEVLAWLDERIMARDASNSSIY